MSKHELSGPATEVREDAAAAAATAAAAAAAATVLVINATAVTAGSKKV
jgi:hypothetical protein